MRRVLVEHVTRLWMETFASTEPCDLGYERIRRQVRHPSDDGTRGCGTLRTGSDFVVGTARSLPRVSNRVSDTSCGRQIRNNLVATGPLASRIHGRVARYIHRHPFGRIDGPAFDLVSVSVVDASGGIGSGTLRAEMIRIDENFHLAHAAFVVSHVDDVPREEGLVESYDECIPVLLASRNGRAGDGRSVAVRGRRRRTRESFSHRPLGTGLLGSREEIGTGEAGAVSVASTGLANLATLGVPAPFPVAHVPRRDGRIRPPPRIRTAATGVVALSPRIQIPQIVRLGLKRLPHGRIRQYAVSARLRPSHGTGIGRFAHGPRGMKRHDAERRLDVGGAGSGGEPRPPRTHHLHLKARVSGLAGVASQHGIVRHVGLSRVPEESSYRDGIGEGSDAGVEVSRGIIGPPRGDVLALRQGVVVHPIDDARLSGGHVYQSEGGRFSRPQGVAERFGEIPARRRVRQKRPPLQRVRRPGPRLGEVGIALQSEDAHVVVFAVPHRRDGIVSSRSVTEVRRHVVRAGAEPDVAEEYVR
mmetsp:Transcript_44136/g.134406  ORF Transcript_44136/g.134406 Transcript_44136/m.134406 type:complete len:530 (-) Transcript_44136:231-1820(-)